MLTPEWCAGRHLFNNKTTRRGGDNGPLAGGCVNTRRHFRVVPGGMHPNKAEENHEAQSCCGAAAVPARCQQGAPECTQGGSSSSGALNKGDHLGSGGGFPPGGERLLFRYMLN
ncbi:hypothetical protein EYF80_028371 [Liparis tanakae]|uniref:Uncharacterized protein n=1 Tax=Liparis tanakae TaxID=230148 RepID=A0A4Z2H914_9TELE|nr:hypothetical protein EYF80_028371 [Liparis tanakae]